MDNIPSGMFFLRHSVYQNLCTAYPLAYVIVRRQQPDIKYVIRKHIQTQIPRNSLQPHVSCHVPWSSSSSESMSSSGTRDMLLSWDRGGVLDARRNDWIMRCSQFGECGSWRWSSGNDRLRPCWACLCAVASCCQTNPNALTNDWTECQIPQASLQIFFRISSLINIIFISVINFYSAARIRTSDWGDNLSGWNSAPSNVTWPACNRISLRCMHSVDFGWV